MSLLRAVLWELLLLLPYFHLSIIFSTPYLFSIILISVNITLLYHVFFHFICCTFAHKVGKTVLPKSANEVKLISSGKILENNKNIGQCKAPFGDIAGGVIIMHVVVQPSLAKSKAGKLCSFYLECIFF